jgi:hypothetical protein
MRADDMSGVGSRPDNDEVVPRDLAPIGAVAVVDEGCFGLGIVHEHEIGVTAPGGVERLTGPLRQDVHGDPGRLGEGRQDRAEQTGILDRCGRGQNDRLRRWIGRARGGGNKDRQQSGGKNPSDRWHDEPFSTLAHGQAVRMPQR